MHANRHSLSLSGILGAVFFAAVPASAQCTDQWLPSEGLPGLNGDVSATVVYDDGSGPALYVGGYFTIAGEAIANRIAKWDGTSWSSIGAPPSPYAVYDLEVYDDGNGDALYVARWGWVPVQKWDGVQLSSVLGVPWGYILDLLVFNDGTGPALFFGGAFENSVGVWTKYLAKWDGTDTWPLGDGIGIGGPSGYCDALGVFDDGTGPDLYVGGSFSVLYDLPADNIARWDGCFVCPEDLNGDGVINVLDLIQLLLCFGQSGTPPCDTPDINNDGVVNVLDLIQLLLAFGTACP